jgi:hypothetical protein
MRLWLALYARHTRHNCATELLHQLCASRPIPAAGFVTYHPPKVVAPRGVALATTRGTVHGNPRYHAPVAERPVPCGGASMMPTSQPSQPGWGTHHCSPSCPQPPLSLPAAASTHPNAAATTATVVHGHVHTVCVPLVAGDSSC